MNGFRGLRGMPPKIQKVVFEASQWCAKGFTITELEFYTSMQLIPFVIYHEKSENNKNSITLGLTDEKQPYVLWPILQFGASIVRVPSAKLCQYIASWFFFSNLSKPKKPADGTVFLESLDNI